MLIKSISNKFEYFKIRKRKEKGGELKKTLIRVHRAI